MLAGALQDFDLCPADSAQADQAHSRNAAAAQSFVTCAAAAAGLLPALCDSHPQEANPAHAGLPHLQTSSGSVALQTSSGSVALQTSSGSVALQSCDRGLDLCIASLALHCARYMSYGGMLSPQRDIVCCRCNWVVTPL